jgi:hypothetical protein
VLREASVYPSWIPLCREAELLFLRKSEIISFLSLGVWLTRVRR